jgi:hypothetical protein
MIPHTYADWHRCITVDCGIQLTADYIRERLEGLRNPGHPKTAEFTRLYGPQHTQNVVRWFEQAQKEVLEN